MSVRGAPVVVEMWTDLACPWWYVGKHRLQAALDQRPDGERFEVRLRSFELNPDAPHEPETIESAFIRSHGGTRRWCSTPNDASRPLPSRRGWRSRWIG